MLKAAVLRIHINIPNDPFYLFFWKNLPFNFVFLEQLYNIGGFV